MNNLQRGNGWEHNHAYDIFCGGREGGVTMCYSDRIGYTPMSVSRLLFINA
jgi:hypothetical protein